MFAFLALQELAIDLYPEPVKGNPHRHRFFFTIRFNIVLLRPFLDRVFRLTSERYDGNSVNIKEIKKKRVLHLTSWIVCSKYLFPCVLKFIFYYLKQDDYVV